MFASLTLVEINLIAQAAIAIAMAYGVYLSCRKKKNYRRHCAVFKWVVPVEIVTVLFIMLPALLRYGLPSPATLLFSLLLYIHHAIGLAGIVLWVYIILATRRTIAVSLKLPSAMKLALASWAAAFVLGFFIYVYIYLL